MNLTIKRNLTNFQAYLDLAKAHSKKGNMERAEHFLVMADVARSAIYQEDRTYPDLIGMAKKISEARRELLILA